MTPLLLGATEHPGALAGGAEGSVGTRAHARTDLPGRPAPQPPRSVRSVRSGDRPSGSGWIGVAGLLAIAQGLARNASLWPEMGRPVRRTWALMASSDDFEAWLVAWPPGGAIELHDHGDAAGALVVASGELVETSITRGDGGPVRPATAVVRTGESLVFGAEHVHDVVNAARAPALSVHVYAPRLTSMTFYEIVGARLEPSRVVNYRLGEAIP